MSLLIAYSASRCGSRRVSSARAPGHEVATRDEHNHADLLQISGQLPAQRPIVRGIGDRRGLEPRVPVTDRHDGAGRQSAPARPQARRSGGWGAVG